MLKLFMSLVAPTVPFSSRHCACRGRNSLAPPCTPRRRRPIPTPATIGLLGAPRPRLTSSPAIPAAGLAGIRPAAPPRARGLHCGVGVLSRVICANQGYICKHSILSEGLVAKRFLTPFCVSAEPCKICIKSQKNPKIANPILLCSV
jgi:hypothetical protein